MVPVAAEATVRNVSFHDVNYHSGEPWSSTDWASIRQQDNVTWQTATYASNPNANALRWSTLYNFRFEANVPPVNTTTEVELFRPGTPGSITMQTRGPAFDFSAGDANLDGDVDFADFAELQTCFSAALGSPPFQPPSLGCLLRFDFNDDGDVDLADYGQVHSLLGPP
jgi:hypothetical protein